MKRLACLLGLVALGSSASARDYSFVFRGHDIHIEAARHCRSLSCVSVLIGDRHSRRGRDNDEVTAERAPVAAPPAAPVHARPLPAPVQTVPAATRAQTMPPTVAAQPASQPVPTPIQVPVQAPAQVLPPMPAPALASAPSEPPSPPSQPPSVTLPAKGEQPVMTKKPQAKPQIPARPEAAESDPDSPVGDWKTDGKTSQVRIASCGTALCGYVLDAATHTKGETVLINMKPKNDTQWTGHVYSRASGNSYYGRMTLKNDKTLRVEACALGSFFCSGNTWTRIEQPPASADGLVSSPEAAARVRS